MTPTRTAFQPTFSPQAEQAFAAFESRWRADDPGLIEQVLTTIDPAENDTALVELVRIDMELASAVGPIRETRNYLARFPRLAVDPIVVRELLFEEFRLRKARGEPVSASEFGERYEIDRESWSERVRELSQSTGDVLAAKKQARDSIQSTPLQLDRQSFPKIPSRFSRFELVGLLGQGALGRVYLARQDDLANRFVALKITRETTSEPECLALLQHTNIVPVYSLHRVGEFQAICMPFLGVATLADIDVHCGADSRASQGGRELISTVAGMRGSTLVEEVSTADAKQIIRASTEHAAEKFGLLGTRSLPETLAWMFEQVAAGLAYAHSHQVLHGDIKPANILLSDDGHPLLLDFHLAQSLADDHGPDVFGGTLPFMSAEHLLAFQNRQRLTPACDIFSLGAVFYKLLSGQSPYPVYTGEVDSLVGKMLADRQQAPPSLASLAPQVDVDLATIVAKCLAPNPVDRYQSAEHLAIDLRRHNEHLPLRYASNRSPVNRVRKWIRRHPGVKSMSMLVVTMGLMLAISIGFGLIRNWQIAIRDSLDQHEKLLADLAQERLPLTIVSPTRQELAAAEERISQKLKEFGAQSFAEWSRQPRLKYLSENQRAEEQNQIGSLYLQAAAASLRRTRTTADKKEKQQQREIAERYLTGAIEIAPQLASSKTRWFEQSEIATLNNDSTEAKRLLETADATPAVGLTDHVTDAGRRYQLGKNEEAFRLLLDLVNESPQNIEVWLMLGTLQALDGRLPEAEASFTVAIGLDQSQEVSYFNRASIRRDLENFPGALSDFTEAIRLNPQDWSAYANRAQIFLKVGEPERAVEDLKMAIDFGAEETRVYHRLATALQAVGKNEEAAAAYEKFLQLQPTDEDSLVERGIAMLQEGRLDEALQDFDAALVLNPRSVNAWQTRAHVFSEKKQELKPAIESLNKVVEIEQNNPEKLATRGVLLARSGDRSAAQRDAQAALQLSQSGDTLYRVAGIYALTSQQEPADKKRAIGLLSASFLRDPGTVMKYLEIDPDLQPLKAEPEFAEIQKAIARLQELQAMADPDK
jgi:eukaryotic-like serine/threonine-protein kinase